MVTFTSQTTRDDENAIERTHATMVDKGFRGDIIVYRNVVDVALATIALAAMPETSIAFAKDPNGRFALIGTKSYEDGRKIRDKVDSLREMIIPAFEHMLTKTENKAPSAPKRGFNP